MKFSLVLLSILMTVVNIRATFDWSNLDLMNFQYFKYPSTTSKPLFFKSNGHLYSIRKIPETPSKFEDFINRSKAMYTYIKAVALGTNEERIRTTHIVDPDMGEKLSQQFQFKHGKGAEKLVEFLGTGPSHESLKSANVI
ncbi:hypothetical protein ACKWTF_002524 [Chironomus riparius]